MVVVFLSLNDNCHSTSSSSMLSISSAAVPMHIPACPAGSIHMHACATNC